MAESLNFGDTNTDGQNEHIQEVENVQQEIKGDLEDLKNDINPFSIPLSYDEDYSVPGVGKPIRKNQYFCNCRLTKSLGKILFEKAKYIKGHIENNQPHYETFYSQKILKGRQLKIPGRHVAKDGTIRDEKGYIVLAANLQLYPRGSIILTTLGPGKVYDTGKLKGHHIDIYTNR